MFLAVRAFYMDIQSWALEEPERWARWAAPCPIPPADLRGFGARRRRINERTADRVRERQPLLPALVAHVEERYTGLRALLEAARATRRARRSPTTGPIPLVPRYDGHERVWTAPMPYQFQRQIGGVRRVTSTGTILNNLRRRCQIPGETNPAFRGLHFTPHDFRRLFATGRGRPRRRKGEYPLLSTLNI